MSESTFQRAEFIASQYLSSRCAHWVNAFLNTQMFDCFIQERNELPNDPEVRFFDESITAKVNRSKKVALTHIGRGGKKETAFLNDTSDEVRARVLCPSILCLKSHLSTCK
jgi:hypothetical protein